MVLNNVDEIMELCTTYWENQYRGEPVFQAGQMGQSEELEMDDCYDREVILAAFLSDLGILPERIKADENKNGSGSINHEKLLADYLSEKGFSDKITKLVASQVQAKRYFIYKCPEYQNQLSEACIKTLSLNGGIMNNEEAMQFENDELFNLHIQLRNLDEHAKQKNRPLPDLSFYKERVIQHLLHQ